MQPPSIRIATYTEEAKFLKYDVIDFHAKQLNGVPHLLAFVKRIEFDPPVLAVSMHRSHDLHLR